MFFCNEIFLIISEFLDAVSILKLRETCSILSLLITKECIKFLSLFGNKLCRFHIKNGDQESLDFMLLNLERKKIYINFIKIVYAAFNAGNINLVQTFEKKSLISRIPRSIDISVESFKKVVKEISLSILYGLMNNGQHHIMILYKDFKNMDLEPIIKLHFAIYFMDMEQIAKLSPCIFLEDIRLCFHEYKDIETIKKILSLYSKTTYISCFDTPTEIVKLAITINDFERLGIANCTKMDPDVFELWCSRVNIVHIYARCVHYLKTYPGRDWEFMRKKYIEMNGQYVAYLDLFHSINKKIYDGNTKDLKIDLVKFSHPLQGLYFPLGLLKKNLLWGLEIIMESETFNYIRYLVNIDKMKAMKLALKILIKKRETVVKEKVYIGCGATPRMIYLLTKFQKENPNLIRLRRPNNEGMSNFLKSIENNPYLKSMEEIGYFDL